ncbi:hypothetical protein C4569_02150 [Candidatus Parcubacteria bacterium]|nr:MAG: hypothetical protein C4569_02150 [Candidatus Parcubacteria bacterium]
MKKIVITALVIFLLPISALAGFDEKVIVDESEIVDGNFIKIAGNIEISGKVNGDLFLVAREIKISGTVAGDVFAVGKKITVDGDVLGSIRLLANEITVSGRTEKNANLMAEKVLVDEKAEIIWDAAIVASFAEVKGKISRGLQFEGAKIEIPGNVSGNVVLNLGEKGTARVFGKIEGNLTYMSDTKESLDTAGATLNEVKFIEIEQKNNFFSFIFFDLTFFFGSLVVGLVLITIAPKFVSQVAVKMSKEPIKGIVWGLIFLMAVPVIIILLTITMIGIPLALILLAFYLIMIYISKIFVGVKVGLFVLDKMTRDNYKGSLLWPLVSGLLIFDIVASIPVLGWLIAFVAVLWAGGSLLSAKKEALAEYK